MPSIGLATEGVSFWPRYGLRMAGHPSSAAAAARRLPRRLVRHSSSSDGGNPRAAGEGGHDAPERATTRQARPLFCRVLGIVGSLDGETCRGVAQRSRVGPGRRTDLQQFGDGVDSQAALTMLHRMTATHVIHQLEKLPSRERRKVFAYVDSEIARREEIADRKAVAEARKDPRPTVPWKTLKARVGLA